MGIEETRNMRKPGNRIPPKNMHTQIIALIYSTFTRIYYIYLHKHNILHLPIKIFSTYILYVKID